MQAYTISACAVPFCMYHEAQLFLQTSSKRIAFGNEFKVKQCSLTRRMNQTNKSQVCDCLDGEMRLLGDEPAPSYLETQTIERGLFQNLRRNIAKKQAPEIKSIGVCHRKDLWTGWLRHMMTTSHIFLWFPAFSSHWGGWCRGYILMNGCGFGGCDWIEYCVTRGFGMEQVCKNRNRESLWIFAWRLFDQQSKQDPRLWSDNVDTRVSAEHTESKAVTFSR